MWISWGGLVESSRADRRWNASIIMGVGNGTDGCLDERGFTGFSEYGPGASVKIGAAWENTEQFALNQQRSGKAYYSINQVRNPPFLNIPLKRSFGQTYSTLRKTHQNEDGVPHSGASETPPRQALGPHRSCRKSPWQCTLGFSRRFCSRTSGRQARRWSARSAMATAP